MLWNARRSNLRPSASVLSKATFTDSLAIATTMDVRGGGEAEAKGREEWEVHTNRPRQRGNLGSDLDGLIQRIVDWDHSAHEPRPFGCRGINWIPCQRHFHRLE